ncbi:SH3 domain-containing protein, partial [Vibrio parahaemolyticus]|nr:SH3 domain-containing protein [Vibrio parahaemolyticus]
MVYWNKNLILNSQKVETVNKETTVSSEKKKNPLIDLDVRYVKAAKARIRNMPNLNGKQITLMEFGTPFIVREQKKDEKDDINWLKIVYEDGTEGWISEGVSTTIPLDTAAQYGVITNKLEELLGSNQEFEMGISLLGKNQKDVQNIIGEPKNIENLLEGALNSYKNINVLYNRDSTVKQVTIKNMSVSKAMMLEELGQAQLVSEDDSSYIYRS